MYTQIYINHVENLLLVLSPSVVTGTFGGLKIVIYPLNMVSLYILVGALEPWNFMTFPSYWECHFIPTDDSSQFSEGQVETTNQPCFDHHIPMFFELPSGLRDGRKPGSNPRPGHWTGRWQEPWGLMVKPTKSWKQCELSG